MQEGSICFFIQLHLELFHFHPPISDVTSKYVVSMEL